MQDCLRIKDRFVKDKGFQPVNAEELFNRDKRVKEGIFAYPNTENINWNDDTVSVRTEQGESKAINLKEFYNERLYSLIDSCTETLGRDIKNMVNKISFINPNNNAYRFMNENQEKPEVLDKYYPILRDVLQPEPRSIDYKNPKFDFTEDIKYNKGEDSCPIKFCQPCLSKLIYNYVNTRRCHNITAVINVLEFMATLDTENEKNEGIKYFCDAGNVYLSSQFCQISAEERNQMVKNGWVNEEHIMPFSILIRYERMFNAYGTELVKLIFRNLHPIATDMTNIFFTLKYINNARSNFKFANIQKPNVLLRFNNEKPYKVELFSERMNRKQFNEVINDPETKRGEWNMINETKGEYYNYGMVRMYNNKDPTKNAIWNTKKQTANKKYYLTEQERDEYRRRGVNYPPTEVELAPSLPIYDKCNDCTFEPIDSDKGKVARVMLYCYVMYALGYKSRFDINKLNSWFTYDNLMLFLEWNEKYPATKTEQNRNFPLYVFQNSINPFVYADLTAHVFKSKYPDRHIPDPQQGNLNMWMLSKANKYWKKN